MIRKSCFVLAACFLMSASTMSVKAEVFTLWPFSKKGVSGIPADKILEGLGQKKALKERVIINGQHLELKISLAERPVNEIVAEIKKICPEAKICPGKSSCLIEAPLRDGYLRKIYLVQLDKEHRLVQFSIDIPKDRPENIDWPRELPLPPGAVPITYMSFPGRGAVYGLFSFSFNPEHVLSEVRSALESDGWKSVSNEVFKRNSSGAVFMKETPLSIITVGISQNKNTGKSKCSIYMRRL